VSSTETPVGGAGWPEALAANSGPAAASPGCGTSSENGTGVPAATPESGATRRRPRHGAGSDEQLARAAGTGDVAAFESLYERYHLQLLSFSRHMVGRVHDAEDVVQHTFAAADRAFRSGKVPKAVRPWLYTVTRNRCVSVLRARHDEQELPDAGLPSTENLAAEVEQRSDLRELLADLRALPDDQRAALLLSELGDLSHAEVAKVIGVRAGKVKALVFQARQALIATADARLIPCHSIREELAIATGAALRRRHLRNHLAQCEECSEFSARVRAQRASLAAILPVVPSVALRDSVVAALGSGGAAAAAGAGGAGAGLGLLAAKSTAAKVLTIAAIGGAAAGGGTVAVRTIDSPVAARPADGPAKPARGAGAGTATPAGTGAPRSGVVRHDAGERAADRRVVRERGPAAAGGAIPPGQSKPKDKSSEPPGSRGRGQAERGEPAATTPPGQAKREARGKPTPPGRARQQARLKPTPPGQVGKGVAPAPKVKPQRPAAEKRPASPASSTPPAPAPAVAAPPAPAAAAPAPPAGQAGDAKANGKDADAAG
jgi:RNA polymerase sigma factor (sigma-70 family)